MLYPSIDEMVKKVDSKYTLVVAASKRARALSDGTKTELQNPRSHKHVGVALEELNSGLIEIESNNSSKENEAE